MGIQGLLPLLKDVQTPVHVSAYRGKTLGIDAYVWLHRGAYGCSREIVLGNPTSRYISYALSRIRMLQHHGVKPYLVFDGDKLPAKQGTEEERELRRYENLQRAKSLERDGKSQEAREIYAKCVDITPEMAFQLIKVLKNEGIPYTVAPYEADAQLAFLEAQGHIDGIITEDSDLLVFGCKTVLFKLDQAGNCIEILQHRFWTNRALALAGWTPVEFRQMAILSGCDYLPSIVGMGLKNAHRLLRRYKTVDKVIQAVRLEGKMRVPPTYAREFRKAELTFVHQRVFDPQTQRLVTLTPLPEGTTDEMLPFIGAAMDDAVASGIAEGTIDPISRKAIVDRMPKPIALRSSSAHNFATSADYAAAASSSSSGARGGFGLHRSTTAPAGELQNTDPPGSFYRSGLSSSAYAKKKVVSKEAGLQSLKNFFGTKPSSVGPKQSSNEPSVQVSQTRNADQPRPALAEIDTNRGNAPSLAADKGKGKATETLYDEVKVTTPAPSTQSRFFKSNSPKTPFQKDEQDGQRESAPGAKTLDHAYLHLGGQYTPPKTAKDANGSGLWEDCQDMGDFLKSSPLGKSQRASQLAAATQGTLLITQELVAASVGLQEEDLETPAVSMSEDTKPASVPTPFELTNTILVQQTPTRANKRRYSIASAAPSSPDSGFISSPTSSIRGAGAEENLLSQKDSAMARRIQQHRQETATERAAGRKAEDDNDAGDGDGFHFDDGSSTTMPSSPLVSCRARPVPAKASVSVSACNDVTMTVDEFEPLEASQTKSWMVMGTDPIEPDTEESQDAATAVHMTPGPTLSVQTGTGPLGGTGGGNRSSSSSSSKMRPSTSRGTSGDGASHAKRAALLLDHGHSSDIETDEDDGIPRFAARQVDPITPMPHSRNLVRGGSTNKPMDKGPFKSASMSKLEAFRYTAAHGPHGMSFNSDTAGSREHDGDEMKRAKSAGTSGAERLMAMRTCPVDRRRSLALDVVHDADAVDDGDENAEHQFASPAVEKSKRARLSLHHPSSTQHSSQGGRRRLSRVLVDTGDAAAFSPTAAAAAPATKGLFEAFRYQGDS
ncbi:hypothetical protein BCV70DRAFT_200289 [Testicularia cyperi]|uniref:Uncharacterized protein n=1 Tax=Testicularia cyperi TaxID=1882483 RepID=A0A317XPE6_9BASI|nr:hypothetical protein BCV70DRAFT_200289 [Testicularia cyperi]